MKSIFTKLSTLLFCGVVAMVGCTDFSEDIQAVDVKVDGLTTELNNYKTSTAATIAELQSAIAALEATQEQMAADYAKKSELEAAKSELQDKLNTLNSNIEKAAADAAAAIAALDAAKADKSEVVALKETVETAIAEANAAIAALDAAKADKTQVDKIAGDVATLIEGYQQMIAQFQNLSLIVDGKAEQADLELVQADVNSLKQGYMETVSALQNLAGRMEAAEGAIELAEGDIADLKKAAAEAVFAITNLNAQVEALDARVEALEGEMKKVQSEIALHTETLQNLAGRLEAAEGAIEDEAAAREKADKALQDAVSLLNMGLTNLKTSYEIHVEEFEAYKNNMTKAMEDLAAQDAALANSILDYYNQSIAAVDTAIETLRKEQVEAIAALEKKIVEAWEVERALIYKTIADIQNTLFAAIEEGDAAVVEAMEAADALIYKTIDSYRGILEIAILEGDAAVVEAMEAADALIYKTIDDIQKTLFAAIEEGDAAVLETVAADLEDKLALVYNTIEDIKTTLFIAIEEGDAAVAKAAQDALDDAVALIYKTIDSTKQELQAEIAESNKNLTEYVDDAVALIYKTIASNKADIQAEIQDLRNELEIILGGLTADVTALLERVQSLVYVPDYDDHKATISWAELYGQESWGILVKKSVLRYRVYAKADEDAVAAAKAIATTWTPETFYYEVEPVKRAWTRSATVPASLEITKVEAKGEYLEVEVLAKNFNPEFFYSYWYGDNYPRAFMENMPEEGKPADEKSSYSVSLVLSDGNNNRSTEYTNLVPEYPEFVQAVIIDGTEAKKDITGLACPESENVNLLPYDLDPSEVIVLKDHALTFVMNDENYSASQLIEAGYDIQLDRRQVYTTTVGSLNHQVDAKPQVLEIAAADVKFQIYEENFVSALEENNTHVTLTSALTREQYLSLKPEEKTLDIDFVYIVNGVEVKTTSTVEICNRLVNINFEVDVPWTLETALSTIADSKMYEGPVAATFEYDLAEAVENGKPLEGYSLYSIIHATGITTTYAPKCPISLSVNDETITATLKHGSARYAFPVNNNDDVVDYNQYVVTKRADFEDITFTVTLKMNLLEQAPHQYLEKDVTFTTEAGANGWLFGYWNALEDAYQKFLADGYIGYVDAPETGKAKFFEAFAQTSSYGNMGAMPVVNGKTGIPQNVNIPFTANNNESGEHKFQLWHEQLGLTPEKPYVDGTQHTILQSVKPYFQIPFTFTVNGTVDLPDYALDLDPVRVLNRGNEKIVNVYGEISKETNKYTVDVSDLAKYYYVVNKEGTKSLVNANNDVVTVDFTLSPMAGAEETGYNFNAVADDTDYTLTVDWTKAEPYILPMSEAVVNWGTYPHTEVGVNAILNVNGFPIVAKPITLVTADPLEIALNDVTVEVTHLSGTNADPIVAKVYENFVLTSAVEEGNLFNNNAKTIGGLWYYSKADNTYGVTMDLKFNRVYYKNNNEKVGWDESKIVLEKYTAENVVAPYEVGDLTGNVWIRPDDGDIQVPIYVEFDVVMTHRIHDASKTTCETSGTVTVKFVPEGWDK